MGLDWVGVIRMSHQDRENYIHRYYAEELAAGNDLAELVMHKSPAWEHPCRVVGALRMKDLPDFRIRVNDLLKLKKEQAFKEMSVDPKYRNQRFIDHWLNRTLDEQMAEDGNKYCCDQCPLLLKLNGSDSQQSMFLGITVASCDFRGKVIGADGTLGDLADEAYTEHDPDQMVDYADRLEQQLPILRQRGLLSKDSYKQYVKNLEQDPFAKAFGERTLTQTEYDRQLHWREQNIRQAVHWLRTCSTHNIHMHPDC